MKTGPIIARLQREGDAVAVLAPGVGRWSAVAEDGALVGPGVSIGRWVVLGRSRDLRLPPDTPVGRAEELPRNRVVDCEYGQPLFRIAAMAAVVPEGDLPGDGAESAGTGGHRVTAPTDGVWYLRPSPDAAPFVEVGQRVRRGQPVGLVEVMKTFNQIVFDLPGGPDEAEVVEVPLDDGAEVSAGQLLVLLR